LFDRRVVENAASVHFTSIREEEDFFHLGLRASSSAVIPNGIDLLSIPERLLRGREKQKSGYVLYLGRLNWKKGLDRLIAAMKNLSETQLVIAGENEDGYRGTLKKIAGDLNLTDRIRYEDPLYGARKWELISSASVLVLPSISENFGNVVLEAMAVGTPVVVTEGVGTCSLVESSGAGLVCGGSAEELSESIFKILCDSSLASQMGKNGRTVVASRYDWDIVSKLMEALYYSLAHSKT
jgi:glycosyltransferase involved in cell wall biosynthesis